MADRPDFIQLEPGEDAASVRDRLSFLRGKRVLLIWPEDGTVLTRKLDLVLIQREAMRRAIRLALVTHDPQVIKHAEELNISSFETIGASERGRWRRGRAKVFTTRFQRPDSEPEPDELMEVASRVRGDQPTGRWRLVSRLLIVLVILALLGGAAYVALPTATVIITPAQSEVQAESEIIADPNNAAVDIESHLIPAIKMSVQIEDTGTIETSGQKDLGETLATGSVVFVNQTTEAVTVPAGTTVTTSAGTPIQFRTTSAAELPAGIGLQIEVPIEALPISQGEAGNVEAGLINTVVGPVASRVTVRNIAPTSGGTTQAKRVVSPDDQERLLATLRQQLQSRAYVEMEPRLSDTQFIILETVHIAEEREDWTTFSAEPGDQADTLSLTMRAIVEAVAVDEQYGRQIVYAQMSNQIAVGQTIKPETVTYQRGSVSDIDTTSGRITFTLSGSGIVTEQVNADVVREHLAGRTLNDATAYLVNEVHLADGTLPIITLTPDWFGQMPLLPMRITIQLQEAPA
ncbi:MAG TPA: hypothetical protein VHO69_11250 [Phototrophicaceae bacterium]|nr:hypothetical protein [Phototrophicaceae bacterium]